jgi:hypothetical protein
MFLANKYTLYYFQLISNASKRDKSDSGEVHHIIPKCFGGSSKKDNLVRLTFREHFIAHRLLVKMTEGENRKKMSYALWSMCRSSKNHDRLISSRMFETARTSFIETHKTHVMSDEARQKISRANRGIKKPWSAKNLKKLHENPWTKKWKVTCPDGTEVILDGLAAFCREHNLSMGSLTGWGKTKGYSVERL